MSLKKKFVRKVNNMCYKAVDWYIRPRFISRKWQKRFLVLFLVIVNIFILTVNIYLSRPFTGKVFAYTVSVSRPVDSAKVEGMSLSTAESTPMEGEVASLTVAEEGEQSPSAESIEDKIARTFPEEPEIMLAIAKAESKLNPNARNINKDGTVDRGIFQINSIHGYDEEWLTNPDNNIKAAREIYDRQGLHAWMAYNNGGYLKWK